MRDNMSKLSKTTVYLHWIIALGIIGLLLMGVYMVETKTYSFYSLHKSLGVLILLVVLIRVVWRVMNGWPEPVNNSKKWEYTLAKIIHWLLIIGTIILPVSGMMMSGAGGHGINLFGFELVASNPDPENLGSVIPFNGTVARIGHQIHWIIGYILIALIIFHTVVAIKHHVISKDGTLSRMIGKAIGNPPGK